MRAELKNFVFTAAEGDIIYTRMQSSWYNGPRIRLYAPNGTLIRQVTGTSDYFTDTTLTLPDSGRYTILAGDISGDDRNQDFGLFLQRTNNPGSGETIAFGETKTDSVTMRAELKNFVFTAAEGDIIYTRMQSSWYNGPRIRLYAPNGTLIRQVTGTSDYFTDTTLTLPDSGRYTILAGDISGDDRNQDFGLFLQRTNNPGNGETIAWGETKTGSVTKRAELKNFTFTGHTGDIIYTRMDTTWYNGPRIRLYAPNGTLIQQATGTSAYMTEMTLTLPDSGRYTILAGDISGDDRNQNYGLLLQLIYPSVIGADFSASPTTGYAPLDVQFEDLSAIAPWAWSWDFGDGATSELQDPFHTFDTPGRYNVTLGATNSRGSDTEKKTNYITVLPPPPVADFSAIPRTGTAPLTVKFTDTSSNSPTMWNWTFGDGSLVNATARSPVHTYTAPGTYTVSLNATNSGGSNTRTYTGFITVSPLGPDTDTGVFRAGQWILDYGMDGTVNRRLTYGMATDTPLVGDFNNDGTMDIGVFRAGQWILDYGTDGTVNRRFQYGLPTDKPLVGDLNNDGTTDIGVFRAGQWILDYGMDRTVDRRFLYGSAIDTPLIGDFNNDGTTDIGVFRAGQWILDYGIDGSINRRFNYGLATDKPLVGDFNNDGTSDIGVFRAGQWILDYGTDGTVNRRFQYGLPTDTPLVGKWA